MNNTLWMNDHLYLIGPKIEQVFCFDHLKSLIHQRGGINTDLCSHRPVRMLQCMLSFYIHQEIWFSSKKRTTRCGKYDFLNTISCFPNQALKNSRVF